MTVTDSPRWQYRVYRLDGTAFTQEERLNKCGSDGWELVAIVCRLPSSEATYGYFKKIL